MRKYKLKKLLKLLVLLIVCFLIVLIIFVLVENYKILDGVEIVEYFESYF